MLPIRTESIDWYKWVDFCVLNTQSFHRNSVCTHITICTPFDDIDTVPFRCVHATSIPFRHSENCFKCICTHYHTHSFWPLSFSIANVFSCYSHYSHIALDFQVFVVTYGFISDQFSGAICVTMPRRCNNMLMNLKITHVIISNNVQLNINFINE